MRSTLAILAWLAAGAAVAQHAPKSSAETRELIRRAAPPFTQEAPELENIPASDEETAGDLCSRYEFAAANAAAAWIAVDTLRQRLAVRGIGLDTEIESSVFRLPLYLDQTATELIRHHWQEARVKLERAEYETEKVLKSVGR
jgi:hypothetical protein